MNKNNDKFEGVWIPKEIWQNKSLTMQEKLFFVAIKSLDNEKGCYANNQYFSDFFGVSKRRCIDVIKSLVTKGFIRSTMIYRPGTKCVEKRILTVSKGYGNNLHEGGEESCTTPMQESSPPSCRKVHEGGEESCTDNSISNSISNSIIDKRDSNESPTPKSEYQIDEYTFNDFWSDYNLKKGRAKCEKKWNRLSKKEKSEIERVIGFYVLDTVKDETEQDGIWRPMRRNPLTFLNSKTWEDYEGLNEPLIKETDNIKSFKNGSKQKTSQTGVTDSYRAQILAELSS